MTDRDKAVQTVQAISASGHHGLLLIHLGDVADALLEAEATGWDGAAAFYGTCEGPGEGALTDATTDYCQMRAEQLRAQKATK